MQNGNLNSLTDGELLTACLWAEARGEPQDGQQAVCNVILNRVRKGMAPDLRAVILQPRQFSWTDAGDPNFSKVFTASQSAPDAWNRALGIAQRGLAGTLEDLSKDADHYLNVELTRKLRGGTLPAWVDLSKITVVIGHHTFLRLHP